jgi:phage terminase small subunit
MPGSNRTLNAKQALFIKHYLIDKNGTQAAIRAGYTKNERAAQVQASRLLSNAMVAKEIEKGLQKQKAKAEELAREAGVTKERWLGALACIAFADLSEALKVDSRNKPALDVTAIKAKGLGRFIRKMKTLPGGGFQIEVQSCMKALELIGRHFGWLTPRSEPGKKQPSLSEEQFTKVFCNPESAAAALLLAEAISPPPGRKSVN